MIQVNNLSKSYGGQVLFEDISFNVSRGERIGLVGRNGSGKSTLFKIILEEEVSSGGSITIPRGYRIGALSQHIHFTKPTVIEECMQVLTGDLAYADHLAEKILFGLGFSMEDLTKDPKSFSGGYQLRINLTKALVQNPDFLLLDEPTNYLDIVSLRWLKNFLVNFKGEVLLITHDREFMDGVVTHVMGITRNKIKKTAGNTHKFYELLEEEELIHEKTRLNQEKKIKHLEGFVDKFRAKASKATQAQSKLKQISKMERLDKLSNEKSLGFSFNHQKCPSKVIGDVKDLSFGYDQDNILFRDLSFQIGREDRIAIIGKNGRGKSTLLNVINSKLKMNTGEMSFHNSCQIGHFAQTNTVDLNLSNSIVNEIKSFNEALETSQVRAICGAMMFEGDLADKKIKVLSGGERARVMLGKILAKKTNLLFLDEPTNHLDMESIESLTDAIDSYDGAVIVVTHNEMLLKQVATKLIVFRNDDAEIFLGNYAEFLEKIGWDEDFIKKSNKPKKKKKKNDDKNIATLTKDLSTLEEIIFKFEEILESKNKQIEKASNKNNIDELTKLSKEAKEIEEKIEHCFEKMEVISGKIAEINNGPC